LEFQYTLQKTFVSLLDCYYHAIFTIILMTQSKGDYIIKTNDLK